jgi:hypothetical protein
MAILPPYEKGLNYFKLFIDYENKFNLGDYQNGISPVELWGHAKERTNDDMFYYKLHCHNLVKSLRIRDLKSELDDFKKLNSVVGQSDFLWAFITIGWNEQAVTPKKMLAASLKISKLKYFNYCDFVLEKHRNNGIHHHTHFLVKFTEKFPPSKIIGWIYKSSGIAEICSDQNFIDYIGPQKAKKGFQSWDVYYEYVRGNKKADKLSFVHLDSLWREKEGLSHLYRSEN